MPIYEYECRACGERTEALQKVSEGPLRKCPSCGALKLKRLVSAAAFHLKGTGWYVTDFRDKGKSKPKGDGAETKPETKTETKPETKTETKTEGKKEKKPSGKPSSASTASAD